jgi:PleD family two-component response regulator
VAAIVGSGNPTFDGRTTHMSGRILVVDDEPNNRRVLSALLRSEGYEVE